MSQNPLCKRYTSYTQAPTNFKKKQTSTPHAHLLSNNSQVHIFLEMHIIKMYAKCQRRQLHALAPQHQPTSSTCKLLIFEEHCHTQSMPKLVQLLGLVEASQPGHPARCSECALIEKMGLQGDCQKCKFPDFHPLLCFVMKT